ncbi:MAG: tRNA (adenosine(37)-N6)-dimethylallyltransferase MiaA [Bacteroidetes bacterium]|nr:tRNA (adenosine(37)-N6)-dimethylallyltransferase MiaA [Bacteroidota bacterium]MBU1679099.1 tRNA (adenosine(37)-N6)-dimethylallyltransferase MiaA [Bacteroidota bacterium]MBU2506183.1 tRNA (adenosine(37)-N6)-dimethylallyltransferase MiaA [Bacteroidota bacterium]
MSKKLVTVLGPTAVGKTKFAVQLANKFNGEIISADSRQVYKRMDIGTGKDLSDYFINDTKINYHLIDIVEPSDEFNLFGFTRDFNKAYDIISENRTRPFLVGGTALYIHSILKNYSLDRANFNAQRIQELEKLSDEELKSILSSISQNLHNTTDLLERKRIINAILIAESRKDGNDYEDSKFEHLVIGINDEKDVIKKRITSRLKTRLSKGLIEEVKNLLNEEITHEKLKFFGLEYKFISLHLSGELNYNDMYQKLNSAIHHFAKRQMTWFRKMEREGIKINWMKNHEIDKASELVGGFF